MQGLSKDYVDSLLTKNVLSLDPAERCGYHSVYGSGTKFFPNTDKAPKKLGDDYGQMKNFREWLMEIVTSHDIRVVVSEALDGGCKSWKTSFKLGCFHGIIQNVCESCNVPLFYVNQKKLKSWATGNGNADKKLMIEYCKKRWNLEPIDDNESDAIHLFYYFCKTFGVRAYE